MKDKYIVIDWANNLMFNGKKFEYFEDGIEYIEETGNSLEDCFCVLMSEYTPNFSDRNYLQIASEVA
jgi:hypothetical protein